MLPSTLSLINEAWDKLLPQAAQKAGSKALRAWLQTLAGQSHPLQAIAAVRLNELETLLAGNLRKDAAAALAAKQWERAKTLLAQIRAEYSESAALSAFASSGLEQVTQGFKDEADGAFDMRALKPQTAALASYQKLFENADSPALKGYARYWHNDY